MTHPLFVELEQNGRALVAALTDFPEASVRQRPAAERWSPIEIACHLLDEEREDFRVRLRSTLEDPTRAWPPIDPRGAVIARDYASRDMALTLAAFAAERAHSLEWLRGLDSPDWEREKAPPPGSKFPPLRAGDLLAAWAAHDLLHLAQIATTRLALLEAEAHPYHTNYAR